MASPSRPGLNSIPTGALAPVGIDRARLMAWWDVQRTDINQKVDASTDPTHSHWIHKFHLNAGPTYLRGRIVDSIAYTNCYKVQFNMWGTMWCSMALPTATQPMGARQLGQLPVGCGVLVLWYKDDTTGIIVGTMPDAQTDSRLTMTDFISQQGRSGLLVDEVHHYPVCQENASLITDWSAGRPFDATTEGERGEITETGLLDFIDSFMATKRVDEECGIWHFWHDQMTRLAGHNFQQWTAGTEREDLDDEGEFDKVEGHTPYYWEALGAFEYGQNVTRNIPTKCWQKDPRLQGYSATEPCDDHQQAFYRLRDFYGYLGQGHKRVLCVPPVPCTSDEPVEEVFALGGFLSSCSSEHCSLSSCSADHLNLLDKELVYPGVFEEDLTLTGRYAIRSAHEIIFSKHILIPVPKQMIRPEDPRGDSAENYHAAGHSSLGSMGNPHLVEGEIKIPAAADDDPSQIRAAGFMDTHAFVFNWLGNHPFHYHEQDWLMPEESDLTYLADCQTIAFEPPAFQELVCYQFLQAPAAIPIKVDHRYKEVKYYPNHSYFGMHADGGIAIGCGFGAEIRLVNGHIYLTAPADISINTGRDFITFAGYDIVLRAKNSWDISATNKDGRLKAKRNLWMVASGDCGGILIQSKAKGVYRDFAGKTGENATLGGIVIKAEDSAITQCAKDMAFNLAKTEGDHALIFDAGWRGRLRFKSKFFERFTQKDGAALDFWVDATGPQDAGTVTSGTEHWHDGTVFCSPVVVNSKLLVTDCIAADGDLVSMHGHVITKKARSTGGRVGALVNSAELESTITYFQNRSAQLATIGGQELTTLNDQEMIYDCDDVNFTFRSVPQYRTNDFVIFESRWQQLARIGGTSTNVWKEEAVDDTYPYPGKEKLLGETYRTLDPKLYNMQTGVAEDRGPDYEDPEFSTPEKHVLNENYTVII